MPDDHSELVPPLPIPNRTVKRLSADDSAATSVKVGHRQAVIPANPRRRQAPGVFALRHPVMPAVLNIKGCMWYCGKRRLRDVVDSEVVVMCWR